jgi:superfamily I DNA/RNA helicase
MNWVGREKKGIEMAGNLSGFDASQYAPVNQSSKNDFEPNHFQQAVFQEVESGSEHLVVQARAGTGKTTTILQASGRVPGGKSVLFCCFNKAIQLELAEKAPAGIDVRTYHSLGYGCVRKMGKFKSDNDRTKDLVKSYLKERDELYIKGRQGGLCRLVGLAKNTLVTNLDTLVDFAYDFGIQDVLNPAEVLAAETLDILNQCKKFTGVIDYDDMIWLPVIHNLLPKTYDVVFIDEAQDTNNCQLWIVNQALRRGGRLIAVGDPRQAIYQFRGAGHNVIDDLIRAFDAKVLPLSITYRCPKKVVEMAKEIVPDYEAAPTAPEGVVEYCEWDDCVAKARPGCFILSRTNAPLMRMCLDLLSRGTPAKIVGKDIGKNMITLIKKSKTETVPDLTDWLKQFKDNEKKRLMPDRETAYGLICDKVACLGVMMEGLALTSGVNQRIEKIFSDTDSTNVVMCSTVHKAKGLERPTVWVLADTFRNGKGKKEEDNIFYVAITRTQKTLMMVSNKKEWR